MPERLLRCAATLFASRGFDATSVQDVVAAAHLTKGAFYYYFESKDQLLYEMHRRVISHQLSRAGEILAEQDDPREALRGLVIDLIESIDLYHDEITIVLRENHRFPPSDLPQVDKDRLRYQQLFTSVIVEGQRRGVIRTDISPELMTRALLGMCTSAYEWYRRDGWTGAQDVGCSLALVFLEGVVLADAAPDAERSAPLDQPPGMGPDGGQGAR